MKKILAIVLSVITFSLCLTGCVYEDLSVKLNKDETGSIAATIGLKKEFVDQMMNGQNPFDGKETKEIEYDGEKYIAYTEVTDYVSFDEIAKALSEMTYDTEDYDVPTENEVDGDVDTETAEETEPSVIDEWLADTSTEEETDNHIFKSVEIKKDGSKYVFSAVLNKAEGQVQGYDLSDIFKVSVSVEMPAKVTAYKNGTVDGNKVTFDLSDLNEETELYAECKVTSKVPAFIGLGLAVVAVVAFIVLRKRK